MYIINNIITYVFNKKKHYYLRHFHRENSEKYLVVRSGTHKNN